MSRIPSLPYRCVVFKKPMATSSQIHPAPENHNYANMAGAIAYREIALRRPNTRKVEIIMVLDESTPSHSI